MPVRKESYDISPNDGRHVQCIDRIIRQLPIATLWLRGKSAQDLSDVYFRKLRQAKNGLRTCTLMMVMLRVMARRGGIVLVIMIVLAHHVTDLMHHGMQIGYANPHTQKGEKQEQRSEQ
jgi:hypothetical protein